MFDTLEADIVVMQETKIQRKDLRDDMVLVKGWDCYFSLPTYKKGYSGVAVYTRQSVCAPVRAEEGVTGILQPPNSSSSYRDLPSDQSIGGYPTPAQLAQASGEAAALDSEGRCLLLEFPAFVLIGVYCPANRDETRDDFRVGFLNALDARVRNLVACGKRVILTGDINISRDVIDTANAEEHMRKHALTGFEYVSTPARRLFNQLLIDGKVFGERDNGRDAPVLWDICRGFHPGRKGMYTCWEQKINARPGNYGSRIDYVLCSADMKDWFCDANIQEGLLGSDHCPVYAIIKDRVRWGDGEVDIRDVINPPNTFRDGKRLREYSTKDVPALSGKLIPEFNRRRNIRDMFTKKPSLPSVSSNGSAAVSQHAENDLAAGSVPRQQGDESAQKPASGRLPENAPSTLSGSQSFEDAETASVPETAAKTVDATGSKRGIDDMYNSRPAKRSKSGTATTPANDTKGQKSLKGFFSRKSPDESSRQTTQDTTTAATAEFRGDPRTAVSQGTQTASSAVPSKNSTRKKLCTESPEKPPIRGNELSASGDGTPSQNDPPDEPVIDPAVSKKTWLKLFTKKPPPRCEGHDEACLTMVTKKAGINCGRPFWMCSRPLGPSGNKERGTEWRCQTFIWSSDWNAGATS